MFNDFYIYIVTQYMLNFEYFQNTWLFQTNLSFKEIYLRMDFTRKLVSDNVYSMFLHLLP